MGGIRGALFLGLIVCSHWVYSQHRYMVFFSDKDNSSFSLDEPEKFLSARAIERKARHQIALDSMDLPVNETYIAEVRSTGAEVFFKSRWLNAVLAQMTSAQLNAVRSLDFVDSVNYIAKGTRLSYDKSEANIPDTFKDIEMVNSTTNNQLEMIGADAMHRDGFTGEGMLIAVFDAGFIGINEYIPFEHLYKNNRVLGTKDFVANSGNVYQYHPHGSSVLSTIAASYGNDISGTAPDASFLLCVTEDVSTEYRIEEYNWLLAAEYADSAGADVINGSVGYSTFSDANMNYTYEDMTGKKTVISRGASMAVDKGMIVVVSAGNEGNGRWTYVTSPADAYGILAVGSVTSNRTKASHSSYGPTYDGRVKPDICAMGQLTTVFYPSGVFDTGSGTSYASPQIAGLAAGIWQANPSLSNVEIMQVIRESGSRYTDPDTLIGNGIANYSRVSLDGFITAADVLSGDITVYPNPIQDGVIHVDFNGINLNQRIEIRVLDSQGRVFFEDKYRKTDIPEGLEIHIPDAGSGMYFLSLRSRSFDKTVKLIKK